MIALCKVNGSEEAITFQIAHAAHVRTFFAKWNGCVARLFIDSKTLYTRIE